MTKFEPVPFIINIPQSEIDDLNARLAAARFPDTDVAPSDDKTSQMGMGYGPKLDLMKKLAKGWKDDYSWRETEARLNKFNNYKVDIEGLSIHYIHEVSTRPDAIPLILVHGWPGTFDEFTDIIPHLTNPPPGEQAFNVVIPNQPGFVFSSPPKGFWVMDDTARVFNTLMLGLGYDKYAAQGGDWGSVTVRCLGSLYPQHCKAVHLNFCPVKIQKKIPPAWYNQYLPKPLRKGEPEPTAEAKARAAQVLEFVKKGSAYYSIQQNTPRTAAYGLIDSPVGILGWLAEKLLGYILAQKPGATMDINFLYTTCTLFYFTKSIGTSFLPYTYNPRLERFLHDPKYYLPNFALSIFPNEIMIGPLEVVKTTGNLKYYKEQVRGGHFAAKEVPELLAPEIRESMKILWPKESKL